MLKNYFKQMCLFYFIPSLHLENIDDISRNLLKYSFTIALCRDEIDAINDL